MSHNLCAPSAATATRTGHPRTFSVPTTRCRLDDPKLNRRLHDLASACELLADGFDGLDELVAEYVACNQTARGRRSHDDVDQFLAWLEERRELSEEQQDFVVALRGQTAVEWIAVRQRLAHARFQELLASTPTRIDELEFNHRLQIDLNPIHVWSQFETRALLDEDADIPATVLFVGSTSGVRTVLIEAAAETILRMLEARGTLRVCNLLRGATPDERRYKVALLQQLAEAGVIALS